MMKKYLSAILLMFVCSYLKAQLDIKHFKKIQIGAMYDKTTAMGLYVLQNPNTAEVKVDLEDYRTTINGEIKVIDSQKDFITTANLEGFAYILGRLVSLGSKEELFYDFDTPLDPLSAGDCQYIKFPSGAQYTDVARFSNNHLFDITTSRAIKEGPLFIGINGSLRTLGFPPRYTFYKTEIPSGQYALTCMAATWKILYGVNLGLRTNLGNKAALLLISGVNTGINSKTSNAIQVKYNPFVNTTIYIGNKYGAYFGFYWEMMEAKNRTVPAPHSNLAVGVPTPSKDIFETKVNESQIQLKVGFYFTSKKERSN